MMPPKSWHVVDATDDTNTSMASLNKPKVFELPLELLMEILSHFQVLHTHTNLDTNHITIAYSEHIWSLFYLERTDILRSVSQTCKAWRIIFLPLLWERLEACATHSLTTKMFPIFGTPLVRKSMFISTRPELAAHIRSMSVILSWHTAAEVLPAFINAIKAAPNLHTLHVVRLIDMPYLLRGRLVDMIKAAFQNHVFPQIRTVVLPSDAGDILRCCPEVETVICTSFDDGIPLVEAIAESCKKVEVLEGFRINGTVMKHITEVVPLLRSITLYTPTYPLYLRPLFAATRLVHIGLTSSNPSCDDAMAMDLFVLPCLEVAKNILQKSEAVGVMKTILIKHNHWSPHAVDNWSKTFYV
ncbi:hypothetical protein B0H34DRAFT_747703 [Crassisporium funariophilum]|nr:hypothetical protein B0H34DRAFT_747703 [Crassisporium funariophilum]